MIRRKWLKWGSVFLLGGLSFIQLIPYGRAHTNPPVTAEPLWDTAATRDLTVGACFDCHSNETEWPWYTNIAPFSWMVERDVDEGRRKLNFSEWGRGEHETDDIVESVEEGEMPPVYYGWVHSSARLTEAERRQFVGGLRATFGDG